MFSPKKTHTHRSSLSKPAQRKLFGSLRLAGAKRRVKQDFLLLTITCPPLPRLRGKEFGPDRGFLNLDQFKIAVSP